MIIVHVEYDSSMNVTIAPGWPMFEPCDLREIKERIESVVGFVFEEEQTRVDVRIRPFGEYDEFEEPLFFTVEVLDEVLHHKVEALTEQFKVNVQEFIDQTFGDRVTFRILVKVFQGAFTESSKKKHIHQPKGTNAHA